MKTNCCSCVIVNYNDAIHTKKLALTLIGFQNISTVCIVDNASVDDSRKVLETIDQPGIHLVWNQHNGGYGAGNNTGIRYLKEQENPKYILIANPDVMVEESLIDRLLQELEGEESLAAVTGQPVNLEQEARQLAGWNLTGIMDYLLTINAVLSKFWCRRIRAKGKYCDCLSGSLLMVKTEIMLTYGMYDERFFLYCEENVLGWKLRQAGFRSCVIEDSYIHAHSVSIKKAISSTLKRQKLLMTSHRLFVKEYYGIHPVGLFLLSPYFTISAIMNAAIISLKERKSW